MPKSPARNRALGAILASLVLHAAALAWLIHAAARQPPTRRPNESIELTIDEQPPLPAKSAEKPAPVGHASAGAHRQSAGHPAVAMAAPQQPPEQPPVGAVAQPSPHTNSAGDVPAKLNLSLRESYDSGPEGGRTLRNEPGQTTDEVQGPSIEKRLQTNVDAWVEEDKSTTRVDEGLIDEWFLSLGHSIEVALANNPPPNPSLASYATDSRHAPSTWAVVDLIYGADGILVASKLLRSSGDGSFNSQVLKVVAIGLPGLPPQPDGGFGIHAAGTHSVWQVSGRPSFERDLKSMNLKDDGWYLPIGAVSSLLSNADGIVDFRHPHIKVDAKLLQVY